MLAQAPLWLTHLVPLDPLEYLQQHLFKDCVIDAIPPVFSTWLFFMNVDHHKVPRWLQDVMHLLDKDFFLKNVVKTVNASDRGKRCGGKDPLELDISTNIGNIRTVVVQLS